MRSFTVQAATLIVVSAMAGCTLLVPGSNHTRDDAGTDTGEASDARGDASRDAMAPMPDAGVDAFVASDAGVDAFVAPDANLDAYTPFDAWEPDAYVVPDAYVLPDAYVVPDAYVSDACTLVMGYPDMDSDGYGQLGSGPRAYCAGRPNFATNALDCNDGDEAVHPGAAEMGCDGVDDNCDGWDAACGASACATDPSFSWGTCTGAAGVHPRPVEVAAGGYHSCVRTEPDNEVWCWGLNSSLQSSGGSVAVPTDNVVVPRRQTLVADPGAVSICAGNYYTCMARGVDGLDCFGSMVGRTTGLHWNGNIVQVACGERHACFRTDAGNVHCLGLNGVYTPAFAFSGQTGHPMSAGGGFLEPSAVLVSGATDVAVGGNHSCARLSSGAVQCWGANDVGQLGRGVTGPNTEVPVNVMGSGMLDVAIGQYATCARTDTGVLCWGYGGQGVVADRSVAMSYSTPLGPSSYTGTFTSLAEGFGARMVALNGTSAFAWGTDETGVLARNPRGSAARIDTYPTRMFPLGGPMPLPTLAISHSVINDGPITVPGGHGLGGHACAIQSNATRNLWCWGSNTQSQCGRSATPTELNAVQVTP